MRVLLAVLVDLWEFFISVLPRPFAPAPLVSSLPLPLLTSAPTLALGLAEPMVLPPVLTEPLAERADWYTTTPTACRSEPVQGFDNQLQRLPYGTAVALCKRRGRWAQIQLRSGLVGWVLVDELAPAAAVLPTPRIGRVYDDPRDPLVQQLRRCIGDPFGTAATEQPLLGVEWVTFALWRSGRVIAWPQEYGRVAGSWQRKLRGVPGIHIDVVPSAGAIMEYVIEEVGYVAYVETVTADLEIVLSAVGLTHEGQYTEMRLAHADWREFHPVFIQVT